MSARVQFADVPPPDVVWLATGGGGALVAPGDHVEAGQLVAGIAGTSGAAVAPLRGTAGQPRPMPLAGAEGPDAGGETGDAVRHALPILVDDDAERDPVPRVEPARLMSLGREHLGAWVERLERAGVRSRRHNSPDLSRQLLAASRRPVDTIVCHAMEADPHLPLLAEWGLWHAEAMWAGIVTLARLTGANAKLLAVPGAYGRKTVRRLRRLAAPVPRGAEPAGDADEAVQDLVLFEDPEEGAGDAAERPGPAPSSRESKAARAVRSVRVVPLLNTYPQADPTLMAWSLLRRRLPPGALPTEAGFVLVDAATAVAVGRVARGWTHVPRLPVGLRDHRGELAVMAEVWRGTRVSDVMAHLGLSTDRATIRAGDFLRDRRVEADAIIDGGEITFHVTADEPAAAEAGEVAGPAPCIRCGWCIDICPTQVHPAQLLEAAQRNDPALARRFGLGACVECGLCSYVCPSRLPLLEAARHLRRPPIG